MGIERLFARGILTATLPLFLFLTFCERAAAQETGGGLELTAWAAGVPELPDAPELQQASSTGQPADVARGDNRPDKPEPGNAQPAIQSAPQGEGQGQQTKRILGIVPNFRSVSVNSHLPPQSAGEKFKGFTEDSFDYSSFIFVGILSGVSQIQGSTPEFHTGPPAYARYYWHNFADQTDENLWVGFLLPAALHQDPRFYTLGSGSSEKHNGLAKRAAYAFTRVLITRTDSGGSNFNFSEVVGSGAAAGISNLYYPASNRDWTKTGQRWALNVGIDSATFIFKEFWPDLNHAIFHGK